MPRVPYNPAPSVEPITPGEQVRINVPPAAFGANIAAALEHLGTTTEHVGDELFNRAIAMQQLNNENEARDLQTQHAQQTAQLVADYDATEGQKARAELMPHLKRLQAVREGLAGQASNPQVQRMFLNDTAGFMQRETFSAARHAGDENRKYTLGTMAATKQLNIDGVRQNPDDENGFQETIRRNAELTRQEATVRGIPEGSPLAELGLRKSTSQIIAHRILGVNDTDPDRAAKMLEDNRGELTDEDWAQTESRVKSQSRSISSTNIANEVIQESRGDDGEPTKTVAQMVDRVKELAKERHPDDPIVAQHAITTLHTLTNIENWERKQQKWSDTQTVEKTIGEMNIQNIQQLRAVPGMQDTIARLGAKYENDLPNRINRINVAKNRETNQQAYLQIQGLYNNDRETFLNTDLTQEHLSYQDLKYWIGKQAEAKEKAQADPRVHSAMSILETQFGSQLRAMGVNPGDKKNLNSNYNHFTGALQQALEQHQQDTGKPAKYDDIVGPIWKTLQSSTPGRFWGQNYTYQKFKSPLPTEVPEAYSNMARDEAAKAGHPTPTDSQIYQAYLRQQFKALFSAGSSEKKP